MSPLLIAFIVSLAHLLTLFVDKKHLFSKTGGFAMEVWLALTLFMF